MSGKVSLVQLRSWNDGPPKIRGIAPADDERSVKLEPDHHGHFLAEEIQDPENDPRFAPRGRTFSASSRFRTENGDNELSGHETSFKRRNGDVEKSPSNRVSYNGFGENELSNRNSLSSTNLHSMGRNMSDSYRSDGENMSPDNNDSSSVDYTPPSSPVSGRYRNLGPELAATIPKRTIKSNWISGMKSRWIRNTSRHVASGRSSNLKSYNSTPSLVASVAEEGEEAPFYNPLYNLPQPQRSPTKGHLAGSSGSSSGIVVSADDDSQSDRSRSSLSIPLSYSPSPPPRGVSPVTLLRQQIVHRSSCPNGFQKFNSLTDLNEEGLGGGSFEQRTSSHQFPFSDEAYDPKEDDCVLVEVIRKSETNSESKPASKTCNPILLERGEKHYDKRHSIGELEPFQSNKFAGVKVEGSPGKVARIKENIKKFGRFGKNNSEKVLRFHHTGEKAETKRNSQNKGETSSLESKDSVVLTSNVRHTEPTANKRCRASNLIPTKITSIRREEEVGVDKGNQLKAVFPQPQLRGTSSEEGSALQVDPKKCKDREDIANTTRKAFPPLSDYPVNENARDAFPQHLQKMAQDDPTSLTGDQDRSITSHLLTEETIDPDAFVVHSGCSAFGSGKRTSLDLTVADNEVELQILSSDSGNTMSNFRPEPRYRNHINNAKGKEDTGPFGSLDVSKKNGTVSIQVPVQAINPHVEYGVRNTYCNSIEDYPQSPTESSASDSQNELEWHRSSTRQSFRGFCESLLSDEKVVLKVPEVVEASISFDNEDTSSLEADEERENSVDYISIADVKMRNAKKSDSKSSPRHDRRKDPVPSCVISLDIGSRGSGYSYWVKDDRDCVRIGNVDLGSTCPRSHKIPTWVSLDDLYLQGDDSDTGGVRFGYNALNRLMSHETTSHFLHKWRENFNEGSTFPYTLESKTKDAELQAAFKSAIKHFANIALEQISLKSIESTLGPKILAITIPASFDKRARELVRDAAMKSEVVLKKDALVFVEDPCAAGLFAYHAIKSKLLKMSSIGTSYLSVDIGGVYLHVSGYEYKCGLLHQKIIPKSLTLSGTPESLFEAELSGIFTPSFLLSYQSKYTSGWIKLLTEFDQCKALYDSLQQGYYHVFLPSSFVDHFRRFTSMEIEDAVESSDFSWNKVGALGIPSWKMQRLMHPLKDFVGNQITSLLRNHQYEFLVLTGGRAGSKDLVDHLKQSMKHYSLDVIVPKEYNAAVLQGSTISLTSLAPRLIIKSPFSIGVGVMTPFIEHQHPEEKRVERDGRSWCADAWDGLLCVGQDLEVNKVVLRKSYVGAQVGQTLLILPLFQSREQPKFVTEPCVKKCCEFKFNSGQRAWQEIELVIRCRPSELLITAEDQGITKNCVILDLSL